MDKVWIVVKAYAHQDDAIVGVYSTQAQATEVFRVCDTYGKEASFGLVVAVVQGPEAERSHEERQDG